jgi:hypothetical protein
MINKEYSKAQAVFDVNVTQNSFMLIEAICSLAGLPKTKLAAVSDDLLEDQKKS